MVSYALGFVTGPLIGSFLYVHGGFGLPFYTIGSFYLFMIVICTLTLKNIDLKPREPNNEKYEDKTKKLTNITLILFI